MGEGVETEKAMVVVFLGVLQFPERFSRNMCTPAAELQDRSDVGLEGVADHHHP